MMQNIDMWYGNLPIEATKIDVYFYGNDGMYRGNIYIQDKMIGDYVTDDSLQLEKMFPQIIFNWD